MSDHLSLPSYPDVTKALKKSPIHYHAAQAHGLLCGIICANPGKSHQWETILFAQTQDPKNQDILRRLYEASYQQLNDFSFEFTLLLPSDKTDINQRAEALGLWCQGFLTGLEQSKVPIENRPPSEITEAINDMIEISQVNYDDIEKSEEDETAYFELAEYVRLAAVMIFHELKAGATPIGSQNQSLH